MGFGWVVTDSKSASESDGIRQFFRNPKSNGYLKSDLDGFKNFDFGRTQMLFS